MQRTHFTAHYTLYNCVCDKYTSSELNLNCICLQPLLSLPATSKEPWTLTLNLEQRHQTHTNSLLSTTVKWGRKEIQPVAWKWSESPLGTSLLFQWGLVSDASTLQSSSACHHWGVTSKTYAGARAGVTPAYHFPSYFLWWKLCGENQGTWTTAQSMVQI